MYAGGDSQMNGDMPHDGGHGGGHAVGEELRKTGKYDTLNKAMTSATVLFLPNILNIE